MTDFIRESIPNYKDFFFYTWLNLKDKENMIEIDISFKTWMNIFVLSCDYVFNMLAEVVNKFIKVSENFLLSKQ